VVAEADDPSDPAALTFVDHTVRSGDTLWDIAAAHVTSGDDVRVLIEDIKHHNGLATSVIVPGQVLHIPVG
jgi:LysM repeat protein